jgi:branched-chain amino acid transport system permease protein
MNDPGNTSPSRSRPALGAAVVPLMLAAGFVVCLLISRASLANQYIQLVLMYIGINTILTLSLNLVNGFMGEFSVGHAGFMSAGAYIASFLTVRVLQGCNPAWAFPFALLMGGAGASILGLVVALPSFKTRGDYLAIVTLAFVMIVKSGLENIDAVGGARGLLGMDKLTTLPTVYLWTMACVWTIKNCVRSNFGRGIMAIREDEIAADMMGVNTRHVKVMAFVISSFWAGIAGGLFAHLLQYINPAMFDIVRSTDILVMVYLGGIGSVGGSMVGATVYTVLLELLRPLGMWRMACIPLLLVILMLFRPRGIMGMHEFRLPLRRRN